MKKSLLSFMAALAIILTTCLRVHADNNVPNPKSGIISGRVVDASTHQPMEYVNVALYHNTDNTLVTGTITSPDGKFKLEKVALGEYYLKLSFLGFENKKTDIIRLTANSPETDLADITLAANAAELGGVSVTAERSRVEYQIDKRVINVSQDIVSKGGTAVNVLENTPSIQVDPQGNVTLRGSSDYVVLIDGKPSVMKGSDALKQINAAAIKQIEVITNPSAKYEADGNAGIINIIQKKDKLQGVNGTMNISLGNTNKNSANILVNRRNKKVNVFAGVDFAKNRYLNTIEIHNKSFLTSGTQLINEDVDQYNNNDNLSAKAGIDYDLNDKNTFSLSGNYGEQHYDQGTHAIINDIYRSDSNAFSTSNSDLEVTGKVVGLVFDYTHKFADNHTFSISNNYSSWDGYDNNFVISYKTNEGYVHQDTNSAMKYHKYNYNYQYRFNMDYKRPIGTATLEAGFQYRYEHRMDDLSYHDLAVFSHVWIPNAPLTYKLGYNNDIYSGYVTISDKIWGIGYMLGVRSEYFERKITFSNDTNSYNYNKFMLYPSVHLSKDLNENNQFQLSYSRRINRPQPWLLNKTPGYIDPQNIFLGNPNLEPEFTDAFELNYRFIYKIFTLSAQTYYRNTTNSFNTTRTLGDDGIMVHKLINADKQKSYGIELGMDFKLAKWWQLSTGADLYHYTLAVQASSSDSKKETNTCDGRIISNFTLKWDTRIQAVAYFRGPNIDAQGNSSGFYLVNLAVNQPLMKGRLNIGLSAENILNTIKFDYSAKSLNYDNKYTITAEGMVLSLTASYSFNNFQNKQRGRADDVNFKGGGAF